MLYACVFDYGIAHAICNSVSRRSVSVYAARNRKDGNQLTLLAMDACSKSAFRFALKEAERP